MLAPKIEPVKSEKQNWKCQSCTYLNKNHANFCEMCNINRNGTPNQQLQHSQTYEYQANKSYDKSPADKEMPVDNDCFLCGKGDDVKHCKYCNKKSFCDTCYKKYHNHPNRQWHLQNEIKNAATKSVDAEFISIDKILSRLSEKTSEHQTKSNIIIDETENCLTNCYSKLNQQLEEINQTKLEMHKALSTNDESYSEDKEKRFNKAIITLRPKFDECKRAEWLAIGEDMKSKYQKECNNKWSEKEVQLNQTVSNNSEAKTKVKISKYRKEFEQQIANNIEQKIIGMRVVWESNVEKEWEEYLTNHRQQLDKKMKKKWKSKNKNIMMKFSGEAIDKETDKVYREALDEINNVLEKYKLKQSENLNDLKEHFKMQDMLLDQVEALKRRIKKFKSENSQLNRTVEKSKIKINDEENKNAILEQLLNKKTIEFQKHEKLFKDKEHQLQESVKYIEKIKEKAEDEWDQDRKKLEKEKQELQKSLSIWRTKYYEEQKEYLETIEIFNSNECKLNKDLEKMQKIKQEKEGLMKELFKLNEQINSIKTDFANKKQNDKQKLLELEQEKKNLRNEQCKLNEQISSMKTDFENKKREYEEEVIKWQNICRAQYMQSHNKSNSSQLNTVAPYRPNFSEATEPRYSGNNDSLQKSKQLDITKTNEELEKPFESANLYPDLKSLTAIASKELIDKEDLRTMPPDCEKLLQLNQPSSNRSTNWSMRTEATELPSGSPLNILNESKTDEFNNEEKQLGASGFKPKLNLQMMKQPFDKTTDEGLSKLYSNLYKRDTTVSSKPPIFGMSSSFKPTFDQAIEPNGSNENNITITQKILDEISKYRKSHLGSSDKKLEHKQQLADPSDKKDEQNPYANYKDESNYLLPKNLNEGQDNELLNKTFKHTSNNAKENLKDNKIDKDYPAVHRSKKSSDDNIQQNQSKTSITKEDAPVSQSFNKLHELKASLLRDSQPELKIQTSSNLVGIELSQQTNKNKHHQPKHSTTTVKTNQNQSETQSPVELKQKVIDINNTSSDDEHYASAEEDDHH